MTDTHAPDPRDQPSSEPMFREDRIRAAAYRRYIETGGDALTNWLEAEAEIEAKDAQ